jgi:hypothetical protein
LGGRAIITNEELELKRLRLKVAKAKGWPDEANIYAIPDYPNDMNACLELLKEMMDKGSLLKIYGLPNLEDQFYVSIYNAQARELITNMMSDYLPVAICKAYLHWKEWQK